MALVEPTPKTFYKLLSLYQVCILYNWSILLLVTQAASKILLVLPNLIHTKPTEAWCLELYKFAISVVRALVRGLYSILMYLE